MTKATIQPCSVYAGSGDFDLFQNALLNIAPRGRLEVPPQDQSAGILLAPGNGPADAEQSRSVMRQWEFRAVAVVQKQGVNTMLQEA